MPDQTGSPQFALSKDDLIKIAKGAGIAALAAVLTYLSDYVIPSMKDSPAAQSFLFVALATAINAARKFVTSTLSIVPFWIGLVLVTSNANAQIQLLSPEREQVLRKYIPKIEDTEGLNERIAAAMLYDESVMPRAHQFQPLPGGTGAPYTVFYSQKSRLNNIDRYTNGNEEAPWRDTGGLAFCDRTRTSEIRFLWLPPRPGGGVWPIVVYRDAMDPSNAVNMPTPTQGWKWLYPVNAMVGEVLLKKFADNSWAPYEVRLRLRELDDWDVEKEVPFRSLAELREATGDVQGKVETLRYDDDIHPNKAFDLTGTVISLGPIANAADSLRKQIFRPMSGLTMEGDATGFAAADHENIVPAKYLGGILKADRESCVNCHKHTQAHVDRFANRDWYGGISGSDGIFRMLPISQRSIGPGNKQVLPHEQMFAAGMVEMYDEKEHPATVYQIAERYDTTPASTDKRKISNRRIIGG